MLLEYVGSCPADEANRGSSFDTVDHYFDMGAVIRWPFVLYAGQTSVEHQSNIMARYGSQIEHDDRQREGPSMAGCRLLTCFGYHYHNDCHLPLAMEVIVGVHGVNVLLAYLIHKLRLKHFWTKSPGVSPACQASCRYHFRPSVWWLRFLPISVSTMRGLIPSGPKALEDE